MRQQVEDLLANAAAEKRKSTSRAFALVQSAEAAERSLQENQEKKRPARDLGLEENLKIVAEHNLTRFLGCLYVESDVMQRKLYRSLLLREVR
jgi:hypothetical protein